MKVQLRSFIVEGLNIDSKGFNWKNRLLFTNSDRPNEHIATAYVKIPRPLTDEAHRKEDAVFLHDKEISEALQLLTIFLSCYGLVTDKYLPRIDSRGSFGCEMEESEISLDNIHVKPIVSKSSELGSMTTEETMNYLNGTIPLFEKVMCIIEQQRDDHKLDVALIMYYRSIITFDFMEGFVDLITAFEALYSDSDADLTYKIALRASVFTETDPIKRRALFDYFRKEVYKARSNLVHGKDVSLAFTSKYNLNQSALRPVMKKSLLNYIELASQGKSKTEILKHIDNIALGFK